MENSLTSGSAQWPGGVVATSNTVEEQKINLTIDIRELDNGYLVSIYDNSDYKAKKEVYVEKYAEVIKTINKYIV